jgi:hypothetical protein
VKQKVNRIRAKLRGLDLALPIEVGATVQMRQTLRMGQACATAVLDCKVLAGGARLKCKSLGS